MTSNPEQKYFVDKEESEYFVWFLPQLIIKAENLHDQYELIYLRLSESIYSYVSSEI